MRETDNIHKVRDKRVNTKYLRVVEKEYEELKKKAERLRIDGDRLKQGKDKEEIIRAWNIAQRKVVVAQKMIGNIKAGRSAYGDSLGVRMPGI